QLIEENYNDHGLVLNFIHVENEIKGKHKIPGLLYTHVTRENFSTKVISLYSKAQATRYCDPIPPPSKELPRDYTFILDYSSSMTSKFDEFEKEVISGIHQVPESSRISVV